MNQVPRGTEGFVAAYLDDSIVYSGSLYHLGLVLDLIKNAGLTILPA